MVSTKHSIETTETEKRNGVNVMNLKGVIDYNKVKPSVDLSDQMASYSSSLRKL